MGLVGQTLRWQRWGMASEQGNARLLGLACVLYFPLAAGDASVLPLESGSLESGIWNLVCSLVYSREGQWVA